MKQAKINLSFQRNFVKKLVKISEDFWVIGVGEYVYLFDIFSGKQKWSFHTSSPIIEIILIPNKDGILINDELNIIRLDNYGKEVWKSPFHYDVIVEFYIDGDKVVVKEFGNVDGYSLNLKTGK